MFLSNALHFKKKYTTENMSDQEHISNTDQEYNEEEEHHAEPNNDPEYILPPNVLENPQLIAANEEEHHAEQLPDIEIPNYEEEHQVYQDEEVYYQEIDDTENIGLGIHDVIADTDRPYGNATREELILERSYLEWALRDNRLNLLFVRPRFLQADEQLRNPINQEDLAELLQRHHILHLQVLDLESDYNYFNYYLSLIEEEYRNRENIL